MLYEINNLGGKYNMNSGLLPIVLNAMQTVAQEGTKQGDNRFPFIAALILVAIIVVVMMSDKIRENKKTTKDKEIDK